MRKLVLSALILASAFQTALGQTYTSGDYQYTVSNNRATIYYYTGSGGAVSIPSGINSYPVVSIGSAAFLGSGLVSVIIPPSVTSIGPSGFANCPNLTSVSIPNSVTSIGSEAFRFCPSLTSVTIPNSVTSIGGAAFSNSGLGSVFLSPNLSSSQISQAGFPSTAVFYVGSVGLPTSMATQAQLATTQADLATTKAELATTQAELATTKSQITTAINEGKASGIASVTASPNTWSLFTTSQIQNMAVGDLVLTRQVGGGFVLNYDIEQSTDLQTWTTYAPLSLPLTGLPTDKAFVRIKAKQ